MYVGPLVVFPYIGRYVEPGVTLDAEMLRVLGLVLGVVGLADYGVSLWLERLMLRRAREAGEAAGKTVASTAIIVAALGVSLAVYGLVLTLLGAPGWGTAFYVLCAAHGLHLLLRWPRYESAAEGTYH
jgi:hypothetical protein